MESYLMCCSQNIPRKPVLLWHIIQTHFHHVEMNRWINCITHTHTHTRTHTPTHFSPTRKYKTIIKLLLLLQNSLCCITTLSLSLSLFLFPVFPSYLFYIQFVWLQFIIAVTKLLFQNSLSQYICFHMGIRDMYI